ncbi:iron-sulfur cluster repair di-iron protein [Geomonas sp. Red32]|uniref:iron-sulfur cluster repair di-iron protein n=1 Tax=Geomonas sp. Red32 TaxID=2912856 RepID=UPI00202CC7B5|nr:iron-sulfur cluster repair di-iron protein [Geomonas sp. Red32]MCM0080330.1 iron-sulfur cluster repair di-iron protein [Geomonas sp. Red32]
MKENAGITETVTVGEIVAKDFRTAGVFEKYGIDFCCGGNIAVAKLCHEKGIDARELGQELEKASAEPIERSHNYNAWELPFLADYIVNTHHAYLKESMATIEAYAAKIAQVHGERHPEVVKIAEIFSKIAADMTLHLREEEEILFPAIKKLSDKRKAGAAPDSGDLESLRGTLTTVTHEHDEIGEAVHAIRDLSGNYRVPGDVCNTFMVTYQKLKEFEDDLHKHVHLENNILFPKAAKL